MIRDTLNQSIRLYKEKVAAHVNTLDYYATVYEATAIVMTITTVALSWIAITKLDHYTAASAVIFGIGSITTTILWKKVIWDRDRLVAELVEMEMNGEMR